MAKIANLGRILILFLTKSERVSGFPAVIKIDISPTCTLKCPGCLHSDSHGRALPLLEAQRFGKHDRMSVGEFSRIINQVKRHAIAVSLFYYGDPYAHPNVDELCGIANFAGLNVHLTSHFSYAFSDARIEAIAKSGVTHLTVAVDGATQETYGVTRVNGSLALVLSNLKRLANYCKDHCLKYPFIEVQHLQFAHHPPGEVERVRAIVTSYGIDQFTTHQGAYFNAGGTLTNVVDNDPEMYDIQQPLPKLAIPRCPWPYFSMSIRYNGDVIPCCYHRQARQHTNLVSRPVNTFT